MVFGTQSFRSHENVSFFHDPRSGLKAIIALHSTALGPAFGGCRMWPYASEEQALEDVLRLSRGMSFKNALAGLPFGGGKSVIIADSKADKSEELLGAFARSVESLGGRYITAEDVGITEADIEIFARHTRHISGRKQRGAGAGGNPAPKTAYGVFLGMRAAIELKLSRSDFKGLTVAVQGVGQVGYHLCKLLHSAGASLVIADVNGENVRRAAAEFGARVAAPESILFEAVDIIAPCALGAVLTRESVAQIHAPFIVGAANNQLATDEVGLDLQRRGIVYAPDYVVNAGGIISAALEYQGGHEEKDVWARVNGIYETTRLVLIQSLREQRPSNEVADAMAMSRIAAARDRAPGELRRAS
ncbi:MAG TPA: Glu/Leu/Phe/Val dehydrogenase [Steroidobacteraceae bacterium]|jgi:leucine dehydrogenase|nr:Glu/Leu/Phe/Val dehydrogenase [Steroidobacteraceae bacterium]